MYNSAMVINPTGREYARRQRKLLITGGAGFIASHVIDRFLKMSYWDIVILDRFTYASGGLQRLKEINAYDNPRVKIHNVNCAEPMSACLRKEIGDVDYILHMAAGTHVDNSIACPRDFVEANVFGTFEMLEYARSLPDLSRFIYFSTDEVYGPAAVGQKFSEWDRYNSCNPYSATKAGGEELVLAWANTYGVPAIITHCMNVVGERQHHEKFLPRVVRAALEGTLLKLHVDPRTGKMSSRNYFHAKDVAEATGFLIGQNAPIREKYNIAGDQEISNLDVVLEVEKILGRTIRYELVNPTDVRPGFDVRYGLSGEKMKGMGWTAPNNFHEMLPSLVEWMVAPQNKHWLYGRRP
jgi:dTDP-glucose 4,6-dehydratase